MRPFGYLVTIVNTLDPLGKFDGKADEGFLVGYSISSKAFRVFNSRTRIVQETLHINFLENKPNVAGSGPTWEPEFQGKKPESEVHDSSSSSAQTKKHDAKTKREAKGHTREEGIDYEEVFTLVARIEAISLFLAYASFMGFMVYKMDVKSAFLYGTIEEEVYVCQPSRFKDPDYPDKVYVDDIIFGSSNKDLCLQVKQKQDGIFISQDKYVAEILRKFGLTDGKLASTPIDIEKPLLKDPDGEDVDVYTYISMIGSLMYLTSLRPDIMASYTWAYFNLVAYSDSDYVGASLDKKSTTGGCQFLRYRLIFWQCKKQTVVATSSTEAEYVVAASCCA
nr:hypothetical protein [Tanacetum cinerariifolium]